MARKKFTHRLPEVRITEQLYRAMHNAADEGDARLTDLIRYALEKFFSADLDTSAGEVNSFATPNDVFAIPIVGKIEDDQVVFYPGVNLKGIPARALLDNAAGGGK
jgi:hypothetical protein